VDHVACAYSGARAGEITQLRSCGITQQGGIAVMHLTPDAGTMKTRQARRVLMHEHLIEQGFLEFVKRQGDGPLFYDLSKKPKAHNKLKPSRTPPQTMKAHLGEWVRELGVTDPEVSLPRDNQGETAASIRMRMRRGWTDGARA
jgi:hypothetical protein